MKLNYAKFHVCAITGCYSITRTHQYCKAHQHKANKYGDPLYKKPLKVPEEFKDTDELHILKGMERRCYDTKSKAYKDYGGRGITICDQWRGIDGVKNFVADVGYRPSDNHTIERIDNNGNYEPGNVKWATWNEQAVNRRNNLPIPGVYKHGTGWLAQLRVGGKNVLSKHFKHYDDAVKARKEAESRFLTRQ